eukprot:gene21897-28350_t
MNTSLISSFLFVSSFVYVAVCLNTVKITSRVRNSNNFWMQKEGRATTNDHLSNSFPTPSLARERIVADVKSAAIRSWGALLSVYIAGAASPAMAESLEDVNTKLAGYGLPPILFTPPGFTNCQQPICLLYRIFHCQLTFALPLSYPLVSEFGRGNIREQMTNPLLVQFAHPSLWVVQKTSVNNNGEAGTISANDYIKGDSAFFFVWQTARSVDLIQAAEKKPIIRDFILKVKRGSDDAPYYIVDFGYELNTEAGFLIERRGVMSLTAVGKDQLQGLVTVSTGKRFRNGLEATLRPIAESFRVYRLNSGIFSTSKPSSS